MHRSNQRRHLRFGTPTARPHPDHLLVVYSDPVPLMTPETAELACTDTGDPCPTHRMHAGADALAHLDKFVATCHSPIGLAEQCWAPLEERAHPSPTMVHLARRPVSISPYTSALSVDSSRQLPAPFDSGIELRSAASGCLSASILCSESPPSSVTACSLYTGDDQSWLDKSEGSPIATTIAQNIINLESNMIDAWKALPRSKAENHSKSRLRDSRTTALSRAADSHAETKRECRRPANLLEMMASQLNRGALPESQQAARKAPWHPVLFHGEVISNPRPYNYSSPGLEDSLGPIDHKGRRRFGVGQPSAVVPIQLRSILDPISPPVQQPRPLGERSPISLDHRNKPLPPICPPRRELEDLRWGSLAEAGMIGWTGESDAISSRQKSPPVVSSTHADHALVWCTSQGYPQEGHWQELEQGDKFQGEEEVEQEYMDDFEGSWHFETQTREPDLEAFPTIGDLRALSLRREFDMREIFVDAPVDDQRCSEFWF